MWPFSTKTVVTPAVSEECNISAVAATMSHCQEKSDASTVDRDNKDSTMSAGTMPVPEEEESPLMPTDSEEYTDSDSANSSRRPSVDEDNWHLVETPPPQTPPVPSRPDVPVHVHDARQLAITSLADEAAAAGRAMRARREARLAARPTPLATTVSGSDASLSLKDKESVLGKRAVMRMARVSEAETAPVRKSGKITDTPLSPEIEGDVDASIEHAACFLRARSPTHHGKAKKGSYHLLSRGVDAPTVRSSGVCPFAYGVPGHPLELAPLRALDGLLVALCLLAGIAGVALRGLFLAASPATSVAAAMHSAQRVAPSYTRVTGMMASPPVYHYRETEPRTDRHVLSPPPPRSAPSRPLTLTLESAGEDRDNATSGTTSSWPQCARSSGSGGVATTVASSLKHFARAAVSAVATNPSKAATVEALARSSSDQRLEMLPPGHLPLSASVLSFMLGARKAPSLDWAESWAEAVAAVQGSSHSEGQGVGLIETTRAVIVDKTAVPLGLAVPVVSSCRDLHSDTNNVCPWLA